MVMDTTSCNNNYNHYNSFDYDKGAKEKVLLGVKTNN